MAFIKNIGDGFRDNPNFTPDGCLIMPGLTSKPQLERRNFSKFPLLQNRYFDPQVYCAGMDPNISPKYCTKLATYPWFGVQGIGKFDSKKHKQKDWVKNIETHINSLWKQNAIDYKKDPKLVEDAVRDCIEFQERIGCKAIILPSPLTINPHSDYSAEIFWLDAAIEYLKNRNDLNMPILATVAIRDSCLAFSDPQDNSLISIIMDAISAREVDGIYLVIEQGTENEYTKNMSIIRVLHSALYMTHLIKNDSRLQVGVNFFGVFGLILEAVGADFWASGWYKSRYRLRFADKIAGGRAFPTCWSRSAMIDINVQEDEFQKVWDAGFIVGHVENTVAIQSLITGLSQGSSTNGIPAWAYGPNNNTAAQEHFFESMCIVEKEHQQYSGTVRLDFVENNLVQAAAECKQLQNVLGKTPKTNLSHVQSWLDAFQLFRRTQNL